MRRAGRRTVARAVLAMLAALPLVLAARGAPLAAQDTTRATEPDHGRTVAADSAARALARIAGVQVRTEKIFDSTEARFWGFRLLNALHIVTRPWVVRREVLLHPGQPYDSALVNETARDLRALHIFRNVTIDTVPTDSGTLLRVITQDGWSTTVSLSLRTSGHQAVVSTAFLERNLLGTNTLAQVQYERNPDRSTLQLQMQRPRLIAHTVGVAGSYAKLSDGREASGVLDYPFFSLSSRFGASVAGAWVDGRVLRFFDGSGTATDSVQRRFTRVSTSLAYAPMAGPAGYVRLGLYAQIVRNDFRPDADTGRFPRNIAAALGPWIQARRADYITIRGFRTVGRDEDVDLGRSVTLQLLAAPGQWGYARGGAAPSLGLAAGARAPGGFVLLNANADGLFSGAGLDSGSVSGTATWALVGGEQWLGLVNVQGGVEHHPYPGEEYDLGLGFGPRAFPTHAFTGDRYFSTTAVVRWMPFLDVFHLAAIGVAGFADYGGAWYAGSPRRTGADIGLGLRIAALRSGAPLVSRVDFAYRLRNDAERAGLVLVVGEGFTFERF